MVNRLRGAACPLVARRLTVRCSVYEREVSEPREHRMGSEEHPGEHHEGQPRDGLVSPPFRWLVVHAADHPELVELGAAAPSHVALLPALRALLSAGELRMFESLRFARRRQKWLLGRLAAKRLMQQVLGTAPGGACAPAPPCLTSIQVGNEPSGAPYVEVDGQGRTPWCLSISHRLEHAIAAVAIPPAERLGVDLETIEPRSEGWYGDYFVEQEMADVRDTAMGLERDTAVARIWSAKESVLKLLGVGLRMDTRLIRVGRPAARSSEASDWSPLPLSIASEPSIAHTGSALVPCPAQQQAVSLEGYWRSGPGYVLTAAVLRVERGPRSDLV